MINSSVRLLIFKFSLSPINQIHVLGEVIFLLSRQVAHQAPVCLSLYCIKALVVFVLPSGYDASPSQCHHYIKFIHLGRERHY